MKCAFADLHCGATQSHLWGMPMIRVLFFLLCFLSTLPVSAQTWIGTAPCGVPMALAPNPQGASATIAWGQPVIIIDPNQLGNPLWEEFLMAHECAHHVIGHTLPTGMWWRSMAVWATAAQELQADCWAAQRVSAQAARLAANYFAQAQGPMPSGPGYPTGFQRAQNIIQCAGL